MNIAAILTVFNRKQKTLSCLRHLFNALDTHNQSADELIDLSVFITDDGSTDGTAESVNAEFATRNIHLVQGTGSLFWAGGMRLAWQTAIDSGTPWEYYLLLNDDTNVYPVVFNELFQANRYGYEQKGRYGISSGITCQSGNPEKITYGGFNYLSSVKLKAMTVLPTGEPQNVDLTHANILLVHHSVTDSIGILYKDYHHGSADFDYAMTASRRGFPTIVTARVCGECSNDHYSNLDEIRQLCQMSLQERKLYLDSPTHSDHDSLLFLRRNIPWRFPIAFVQRKIRLYCPQLYFGLNRLRGLYTDDNKQGKPSKYYK